MDEAEATGGPAQAAWPDRAISRRVRRHPRTAAVGVTGAAGIAIAGPRMPAGYAACAAILIAGAVVFILWTADEPLPSASGQSRGV